MSPVKASSVPTLSRQYPHVDGITDWRAQQTIRLLWDRIFDLEARLQAAEGTSRTLVSTANAQEQALDEVSSAADAGSGVSQTVPGETPPSGAIVGTLPIHHTTHEPAGSDQIVSVDASLTTGADLIFKSNQTIRRNTADGSDSGYLDLAGGGASGGTRGGWIRVAGNESGAPGYVQILPGNVTGSFIYFYKADGTVALSVAGADGSIGINSSNSAPLALTGTHTSGAVISINYSGGNVGYVGSRLAALSTGSASDLALYAAGNMYVFAGGGSVLPNSDNGFNFGGGSNRWIALYAVNGTIQTSDLREKTILGESLGLSFIRQLRPFAFRWTDEPATSRIRYGLGAQDILRVAPEGAFVEAHDDRYGMNYSEFIAPLVRAVQELATRVEDLAHGHE